MGARASGMTQESDTEARGHGDLYGNTVVRKHDCPDYIGLFVIGETWGRPSISCRRRNRIYQSRCLHLWECPGSCGWGNGSELSLSRWYRRNVVGGDAIHLDTSPCEYRVYWRLG